MNEPYENFAGRHRFGGNPASHHWLGWVWLVGPAVVVAVIWIARVS